MWFINKIQNAIYSAETEEEGNVNSVEGTMNPIAQPQQPKHRNVGITSSTGSRKPKEGIFSRAALSKKTKRKASPCTECMELRPLQEAPLVSSRLSQTNKILRGDGLTKRELVTDKVSENSDSKIPKDSPEKETQRGDSDAQKSLQNEPRNVHQEEQIPSEPPQTLPTKKPKDPSKQFSFPETNECTEPRVARTTTILTSTKPSIIRKERTTSHATDDHPETRAKLSLSNTSLIQSTGIKACNECETLPEIDRKVSHSLFSCKCNSISSMQESVVKQEDDKYCDEPLEKPPCKKVPEEEIREIFKWDFANDDGARIGTKMEASPVAVAKEPDENKRQESAPSLASIKSDEQRKPKKETMSHKYIVIKKEEDEMSVKDVRKIRKKYEISDGRRVASNECYYTYTKVAYPKPKPQYSFPKKNNVGAPAYLVPLCPQEQRIEVHKRSAVDEGTNTCTTTGIRVLPEERIIPLNEVSTSPMEIGIEDPARLHLKAKESPTPRVWENDANIVAPVLPITKFHNCTAQRSLTNFSKIRASAQNVQKQSNVDNNVEFDVIMGPVQQASEPFERKDHQGAMDVELPMRKEQSISYFGKTSICSVSFYNGRHSISIKTPQIQRAGSDPEPKPETNNNITMAQPSDLVKRIEMIRKRLQDADNRGLTSLGRKRAKTRMEDDYRSIPIFPVHRLGERGSGLRSRGEPQDFYELRDDLLGSGSLFEDPDFPADDSSLFFSRRADRRYEWLRPGEIVDDPQLFVEGYSRFDVQQGELGDCWLLAAVANLTLYRRLFFQIVPDDQGFDDKYAGIFHFRFWQYGRWIDVVIDDKLPTYRGQLIYMRSTEENEFWSALLEKAYAKLHGSYEALKGGSTCEAMEDFTGGVTEMYEMNASPPNLFKIVLKAYERGSLMGCSLEPDVEVLEAETREGLIRGHAYSITKVKYVDIQTPNAVGKIPLLRLRNPWGNENEWNGPWSDGSPEWRFIPDHEKESLGLNFDNDGEFWMSFKDFQTHFDRLEICNLTPDSLTEEELSQGHKKQWEMSVFEGDWVRGVTAGGCRNYLDNFWHNPQYRITLTDIDEDDDESKCTVIVALMQKNRRSRKLMGVEFLTIGFAIYYLPDSNRAPKPLDLNYFKYNSSVARSPSFINLREVSCRFRLPPGTYCIVPSTFEPNEEGEFLLRVFSENKNNMEEHDDEVALGDVDSTISKQTPTVEEKEETDQVREFFLKLAGSDMEVDWKELKDILDYAMRNESKNKGFSKDVCRSMIALLDVDRSGKLGFEEFKKLWVDIRNWKLVFKMYDKDNSGSLSGFELRQALNSAGYRLNNHILNILMHRYGNLSFELNFDDFILCAVKLKSMIELFKKRESEDTNSASFTLEEWIETTLYA